MRIALAVLLMAGALCAQATPLDRLKHEAANVKALSGKDHAKSGFGIHLAALHLALRDWIESRLPQTAGTAGQFGYIERALQGELKEAGLEMPNAPASDGALLEAPGFGYVGFEFKWLPELPDALFVVAEAGVDCGVDQAVYMYHFDRDGRTRVFDNHPTSDWGYTSPDFKLSEPDSQGRRLLLIHYVSVQCASSWMGMAYSAYRLGARGDSSDLLISDTHDFWLGNDEPEFVLKPDAMIIEFLDRSIDTDIHNRTQIHRYSFAAGVHRLDPVAFQPQDFAEEWLTRPWREMQSRSVPETETWHERLHSDFVLGEYAGVIPCAAKPGRWLIAMDISHIGEKELPEPLETYFVVRDLGNFRYEMEAVSEAEPLGCPGEGLVGNAGYASDKHPWLSEAELNALP